MTEVRRPADPDAGQRRLSRTDWIRIRTAVARARCVYPDVVGELVARELTSYGELGWLLRPESLPERVIDQVLACPAPGAGAPGDPDATWPARTGTT